MDASQFPDSISNAESELSHSSIGVNFSGTSSVVTDSDALTHSQADFDAMSARSLLHSHHQFTQPSHLQVHPQQQHHHHHQHQHQHHQQQNPSFQYTLFHNHYQQYQQLQQMALHQYHYHQQFQMQQQQMQQQHQHQQQQQQQHQQMQSMHATQPPISPQMQYSFHQNWQIHSSPFSAPMSPKSNQGSEFYSSPMMSQQITPPHFHTHSPVPPQIDPRVQSYIQSQQIPQATPPIGLSTFCYEVNKEVIDRLDAEIAFFQMPKLSETPKESSEPDLTPIQPPQEENDILFIPQCFNIDKEARALEVELSKKKKQPVRLQDDTSRTMGGKDYSQMKSALQSCFNTIRWISKEALIEALRTNPEFRSYLDMYADEINACPSVIIQVKNWVGLRNELEELGINYTPEHLRRNLFPKMGFSPLFTRKYDCMDGELNTVFWIDERDRLPFWVGLEDSEVLIRRSNAGSYNMKSRRRSQLGDGTSRTEDDAVFIACRPVSLSETPPEKMAEFKEIFLQSFLKSYLQHVGNEELGFPFSSEQALVYWLGQQFEKMVSESNYQKDLIYICSVKETSEWVDVGLTSVQLTTSDTFADLYISQCVVRPEYQRRKIATTMIRQTVRLILREHPTLTNARVSGCCRFINIPEFALYLRMGGNPVVGAESDPRMVEKEQTSSLERAIIMKE